MRGLSEFQLMDGGVQIYRVEGKPHVAPPFFSVPLVWFPPRAFHNLLRQFRPDVLHWVGDGWFWGHFCSARAAPHGTGIIFTPSFHCLSFTKQWLRPLNIALCRMADRITALSCLEAEHVRPTYLIPPHKQVILPWGVDAPIEMADSEETERDNRLTVLCVGRLGRHKNQCFIINAWAEARRRFARPARLVLIGRDEGDSGGEAVVRRLIASHELEKEVFLTGEVTDAELHTWYGRSDLFVLFSQYEAFGLVFFEAMVRGIPVLTHRVGANAELISKGAVLTNPYDISAAIESLVKLVNVDGYRRRLGAEAKRYAARFTWEAVIERFASLYHSVLQERRGKSSRG